MRSKQIVGMAACAALHFGGAASGQFIPGHVFVADAAVDFCTHGDLWDRIWEIDPQTGEVTLFAERTGDDCGYITGLAFTPDGTGLRAADLMHNRILEFDAQGNVTVVLDASDSINGPRGYDGIIYHDNDFWVLNDVGRNIMRFPGDGGPGSVFVDAGDGITGSGAIAFGTDGFLYYAALSSARYVLRITPFGGALVFDQFTMETPVTLATDDAGHVFVGVGEGATYRYDVGDPSSKELLVTAAEFGNVHAMTMSPDQSELWVAALNKLQAIDVNDGSVRTLADIVDGDAAVAGIAIVPPGPIPAASSWGLVVMVVVVLMVATLLLKGRRAVETQTPVAACVILFAGLLAITPSAWYNGIGR